MSDLLQIVAHRRWAVACLASLMLPALAIAQTSPQSASINDLPEAPAVAQTANFPTSAGQSGQQAQSTSSLSQEQDTSLQGKQTKRILGIIPNFRSVSANQQLPPETVKEKFIDSTEDSFDYSGFIFAGAVAGVAQAEGSTPEFRGGATGYGRYYWHTLADQADENYQVEFVFPSLLHQDSRYYTLGHGGFVKRTVYSFGRVFITRTDSGSETFNASEIVGAGAAAGISDLYYPSQERTWTKTGQRWFLNVGLDGGTFVFKEFWPDINNKFFHQKN